MKAGNDSPITFELILTQKVYQSCTQKVTVKPGTPLPKDLEEWAEVLYNGRDGFEVFDPVHEPHYDNVMEQVIDSVTIKP